MTRDWGRWWDEWIPRIRALTISATCLYGFWWEIHRPHPIDWLSALLLVGAGVPITRLADKALQETEKRSTGSQSGKRGNGE